MTGRNLVPEIDEDNPWDGICVYPERLRDKATESRIADVSQTLVSGQNSRCRQGELTALAPVHLCTLHIGAPTFRMRSSAHLVPPRRRARVFMELRGYTPRATPTARGAVHTVTCVISGKLHFPLRYPANGKHSFIQRFSMKGKERLYVENEKSTEIVTFHAAESDGERDSFLSGGNFPQGKLSPDGNAVLSTAVKGRLKEDLLLRLSFFVEGLSFCEK
ncbi:hypothetical protein DFH06DRAFT_1150234 [Mycena polygramma]|nr:hypothetical protein DFH06DRAFT_1150234 [Mycena polygramma]